MTLQADDRLDLMDLYARYSSRFDEGDADGWAALFTENGVFDIVGTGRPYEGREALAKFLGRIRQQSPGIRHFVSNMAFQPSGDGAVGEAAVIVLRFGTGQLRMLNVGGYRDELVRADGGWRFKRRAFTSWLDPDLLDAPLSQS